MNETALSLLRDLLRLPGSKQLVSDASVLSCGCFVSECEFVLNESNRCYYCSLKPVHILKPVNALRSLYKIVKSLDKEPEAREKFMSCGLSQKVDEQIVTKNSHRLELQSLPVIPQLDFLSLFRKFATDELSLRQSSKVLTKISAFSSAPPSGNEFSSEKNIFSKHKERHSLAVPDQQTNSSLSGSKSLNNDERFVPLLGEKEEFCFSSCFPFYRKASVFASQQSKSSFCTRSLMKQRRFNGSAIHSHFDDTAKTEITLFALISDKKWELFRYESDKLALLACGKSTGEFGPAYNHIEFPENEGLIVQNNFSETIPTSGETSETNNLNQKLKSWVMLGCRLTEKFLVISGTKGIMRVFNIHSELGRIGQPLYTYITDFPIRCIAIAPNNELIACGITAKEKLSNRQQPFIILHNMKRTVRGEDYIRDSYKLSSVSSMTITVPFRDPLKILNFNTSSTHLICSTVYEMRYFIIRLAEDSSQDYKRPRLIYSDTRLVKDSRDGYSTKGEDQSDDIEQLLENEDDAQMFDNEGITDIKFGQASTNTIIITSSSMKNKPSVVLKINGPSLDSKCPYGNFSQDLLNQADSKSTSIITKTNGACTNFNVTVLMKLNDIGSNIYGAEASPRGDSILFTDKMGRLLLVATRSGFMSNLAPKHMKKTVVLLGEVAPVLRPTEAASICFSSDGGRIMAVDRKGILRVFDFTKGLPGEDPEVTKCKILSLW